MIGAAVALGIAVVVIGVYLLTQSSSSSPPSVGLLAPFLVADSTQEQSECQQAYQSPRQFTLGCGMGFQLTGLKWSNWGQATTTASGTAHVNICRPDCAEGSYKDEPVSLTLTKISRCPTTGQRRYLHLSMVYLSGKFGDLNEEFRCPLTHEEEQGNTAARKLAEKIIIAKGAALKRGEATVLRSQSNSSWIEVSGYSNEYPEARPWSVWIKSSHGVSTVRYAGFKEEPYVAGAPCDLYPESKC
ncbi:MAG: hypothetical protein WB507_06095 [Solirubrobacterales bacterium]